jgi:hypothetical protein
MHPQVLSATNIKLKDLFVTNVKLKGFIYYLKNLKNLSVRNVKLKDLFVT